MLHLFPFAKWIQEWPVDSPCKKQSMFVFYSNEKNSEQGSQVASDHNMWCHHNAYNCHTYNHVMLCYCTMYDSVNALVVLQLRISAKFSSIFYVELFHYAHFPFDYECVNIVGVISVNKQLSYHAVYLYTMVETFWYDLFLKTIHLIFFFHFSFCQFQVRYSDVIFILMVSYI